MSKNLYLVDVGFMEDTVVYELVPREVARLKQATLSEVQSRLHAIGALNLVVDAGTPEITYRLREDGFNVLSGKFATPHPQSNTKQEGEHE